MRNILNRRITVKQLVVIITVFAALIITSFGFYLETLPAIAEKKSIENGLDRRKSSAIDTTDIMRLQMMVDSIGKGRYFMHGSFGFCFMGLDSMKPLAAFNEHQTLVPASILKVVTTGAALRLLGPGYRYSTRLQYDGARSDSSKNTLNGDIYIMGSGDPTLGSNVFGNNPDTLISRWVKAIKKLKIDTINGAVVAHAGAFDDELIPAGWAWEDMQADYCVGACGLSFRENMFDIKVEKRDKMITTSIEQDIPMLTLNARVVEDKSSPKSYLYVSGTPYVGERFVKGVISKQDKSFTGKGAIPDPPLYCAYSLYKALQKNGITVSDSFLTDRQLKLLGEFPRSERKTIHNVYSPSVAMLVEHTNHVSNNFYAETLLKTIGYAVDGYGSTANGINQIIKLWKEYGVDLRGMCMVDGSGVSRYNGVTALQMTQLLNAYANDSLISEKFYESLPVSAKSGTLRSLTRGSVAQEKIHAKSGYMSRVRSYSGYVNAANGKRYAFTMMANNHDCSSIQMKKEFERIMIRMASITD